MTLSLSLRRELTASRNLAIELMRDERGWIGRVLEDGTLLKATPAYPSAREACASAEFEFDKIVEERVHAREKAEDEGHECWRCGTSEAGCTSCGGHGAKRIREGAEL